MINNNLKVVLSCTDPQVTNNQSCQCCWNLLKAAGYFSLFVFSQLDILRRCGPFTQNAKHGEMYKRQCSRFAALFVNVTQEEGVSIHKLVMC